MGILFLAFAVFALFMGFTADDVLLAVMYFMIAAVVAIGGTFIVPLSRDLADSSIMLAISEYQQRRKQKEEKRPCG